MNKFLKIISACLMVTAIIGIILSLYSLSYGSYLKKEGDIISSKADTYQADKKKEIKILLPTYYESSTLREKYSDGYYLYGDLLCFYESNSSNQNDINTQDKYNKMCASKNISKDIIRPEVEKIYSDFDLSKKDEQQKISDLNNHFYMGGDDYNSMVNMNMDLIMGLFIISIGMLISGSFLLSASIKNEVLLLQLKNK